MKTTVFGAALIVAMSATAANANLLGNAGFESDVVPGNAFPFTGVWESFSLDGDQFGGATVVVSESSNPRTGARNGFVGIFGEDNSFAGLFQDSPVAPGVEYTFSGYHANADAAPLGMGIEVRIEWVDAGGAVISATPNATPMIAGTDYEPFSLTATAPAGAAFGRAVYAAQTFGGEPDPASSTGTVYLDDFNFIPAPGSIALLGLGGLGMIRRRR